jgi:hypothetical protein
MAEEGEVIFDGSDVDNWETVSSGSNDRYDLEFVDDLEEGDTFIGTYDGKRKIGDSKYPSLLIKSDMDETTYAISPHTILEDALEEAGEGQLVRVEYTGKIDTGQPNAAHNYKVQVPG